MLLTKVEREFIDVNGLEIIRNDIFADDIRSEVVEVGLKFNPSDSDLCTVVMSSYISVDGIDQKYQLNFGVDGSMARYTLVPEKDIITPDQVTKFDDLTLELWNYCYDGSEQNALMFVDKESLIDFLKTGSCEEFSEKPSLFLVNIEEYGYGSPYSLNVVRDFERKEQVALFYPKQLEMIRQRAMIPEYEDETGLRDLSPLQKVDLSYIHRRIVG